MSEPIAQEHVDNVLAPRGISAEQAARFGVRSILTADDLPDVFRLASGDFSRYATVPGLLFTWNSPLSGQVLQLRPDNPANNEHGQPVKYVFPAGTEMVLNTLRSGSEGATVLLCEGTMQSLAAAIYAPEEMAVYGMSGCWSWRSGDTTVATPDLMVVEGRDVVVALDADAATNLDVYNAGLALQSALENEGAATVTFLRLDGHGKKAGLDDVLGARPEHTRATYLARLIERAEEKPAKAKPAKKSRTGGTNPAVVATLDRPIVAVNTDRQVVIEELTRALRARFDGDTLFEYGGILAKRGGTKVEPVTEGVFADLVATAALCVTVSTKGDMNPGWPDDKSMRAVLSRAREFTALDRISRVPFVRADGSICQTSGYDAPTRSYLVLDDDVERIEVPDEPSGEDVRSAVKLLTEEWLGDFFAIMPEAEDRANCLAMMLTPMIRGLVPLAPMAVVDGLQMGVGKNLLADLLSIITIGVPAKPLLYNREDEENRKVITAEFRAGNDLLVFDEAHVIEGRALAKALTGITYSDRILGVSNMVEYPNTVTWVALGNNVSINGDLARRVYRVRLAPAEANPQDRDVSTYRHPDIKRWTAEHRHELVAAGLTLIRAWFASVDDGEAPKQNVNGRRFGSFEAWGGMVGGILDHAGVPGFLGSLVEWRSETDYETTFWAQHLDWLREQFGDGDFTVAEVVAKMKRSNGPVEHPPRLEDHTLVGYNRLLGLAYKKVRNRIIAGFRIVKTVETAGHGSRWMVLSDGLNRGVQSELPDTQSKSSQVSDAGSYAGSAPATRGEKTTQYITPHHVLESSPGAARDETNHHPVTSAEEPRESTPLATLRTDQPASLAALRTLPMYPRYPSTAGADPLASLVPNMAVLPAPECLDCGAAEELVPGGHWFSCRSCTPASFDRPDSGGNSLRSSP